MTARPLVFLRCAGLLAAALVAVVSTSVLPHIAWAGPSAAGPTAAVGYSEARGKEFVTYSLGWRFVFGAGRHLDAWTRDSGWRANLVVEPLAGFITGDAETVEAAVVPMLHFERTASQKARPFIEGGVGLIYTDLRGMDLGSQILFSDQIGGGLAFPTTSGRIWEIGYRFRHISHAGLWANANAGLNTHFLTVSCRFPAR